MCKGTRTEEEIVVAMAQEAAEKAKDTTHGRVDLKLEFMGKTWGTEFFFDSPEEMVVQMEFAVLCLTNTVKNTPAEYQKYVADEIARNEKAAQETE